MFNNLNDSERFDSEIIELCINLLTDTAHAIDESDFTIEQLYKDPFTIESVVLEKYLIDKFEILNYTYETFNSLGFETYIAINDVLHHFDLDASLNFIRTLGDSHTFEIPDKFRGYLSTTTECQYEATSLIQNINEILSYKSIKSEDTAYSFYNSVYYLKGLGDIFNDNYFRLLDFVTKIYFVSFHRDVFSQSSVVTELLSHHMIYLFELLKLSENTWQHEAESPSKIKRIKSIKKTYEDKTQITQKEVCRVLNSKEWVSQEETIAFLTDGHMRDFYSKNGGSAAFGRTSMLKYLKICKSNK